MIAGNIWSEQAQEHSQVSGRSQLEKDQTLAAAAAAARAAAAAAQHKAAQRTADWAAASSTRAAQYNNYN